VVVSARWLYHYTAVWHMPSILADSELRATESNLSRAQEHAGPDVVWLTRSETPSAYGLGLDTPAVDKTEVRITVDVPDAVPWSTWCEAHGIDRCWRRTLEKGRYPETWYVVEHPVPSSEWVSVEIRAEGVWQPWDREQAAKATLAGMLR
jgi:hypothetical protein